LLDDKTRFALRSCCFLLTMAGASSALAADAPAPPPAQTAPQPARSDESAAAEVEAARRLAMRVDTELGKPDAARRMDFLRPKISAAVSQLQAARTAITVPDSQANLPAALQVSAELGSLDRALADVNDALKTLPDAKTYLPVDDPRLARIRAGIAEAREHLDVAADRAFVVRETAKALRFKSSALVVSGGVSLGSYQAGFIYYYTTFLREYARQLGPGGESFGRVHIATGASAGSINAFLALLAGCRPAESDPEASIFATTWLPVGINELVSPDETSATGLLSARAIQAAVHPIDDLWQTAKGFPDDCRSTLGVTTTRITPRLLPFATGGQVNSTDDVIQLKRQTEKFVLSVNVVKDRERVFHTFSSFPDVEGFGHEIYPLLGDHSSATSPENQPVLWAHAIDLLRASAAFPGAFSPISLPVTVWSDGRGRYEGEVAFTDGGFLDNTPLRLARKVFQYENGTTLDPPLVFLDSDAAFGARDSGGKATVESIPQSIFSLFLPFVARFIANASDASLADALEDDASNGLQRSIPVRRMPVAGEVLAHFFAFADRDFRRFDFYQGMADARDYLRQQGREAVLPIRSPIFDCFLEYRDAILGRGLPIDVAPAPTRRCERFLGSNLTALLRTSAEHMGWRHLGATSDGELDEFVGRLYRNGFVYCDLGGGKIESKGGVSTCTGGNRLDRDDFKEALRNKLQILGRPLRRAQEGQVSKLAASFLIKTAPNELYYRPASYWNAGFVNGLELGISKVLARPHAWGVPLAVSVGVGGRVAGLTKYYPSFDDLRARTASSIAAAEAELQLEVAPSTTWQLQLGGGWTGALRYQHDTAPYYGYFIPQGLMSARQGPSGTVTIVALQRLYFAWAFSYYLDDCSYDNACPNVRPAYRSYAEPVENERFDTRVSFGWRFLY
jgi:hypothetical protein